jgi:hypothetical protein
MSLRDIKNIKEELKNKKLDAFTQFITYKKEISEEKKDKKEEIENSIDKNKNFKTIIDYYNKIDDKIDENIEYKNKESMIINDDLNIKNIFFQKKINN